ncbi:MAG: hypothetical protein LBP52_03020 [Burkholderiaceae bacterium]|jgi:hypothetical protein|nr:hypothetical protein [Burkholderiaceae bacterium]
MAWQTFSLTLAGIPFCDETTNAGPLAIQPMVNTSNDKPRACPGKCLQAA